MLLKYPHGTAQAEVPVVIPCGHVVGCLPVYSTSLKRQTQEKMTMTVGASAH